MAIKTALTHVSSWHIRSSRRRWRAAATHRLWWLLSDDGSRKTPRADAVRAKGHVIFIGHGQVVDPTALDHFRPQLLSVVAQDPQ